MKNNNKDQGPESIAVLIRQEEEAALAFFRARHFRERIERRLKEEAGGKRPESRPRTWLIPALTGALLAFIAVILLFIYKDPGSAPSPPEFEALASALGRLPGLSNIPGRGWTEPQGQTGSSRLADCVRRALAAGEKIKRDEEQKISIPAGSGNVPRLSPDQRMEILFKERAIERALLLFKDGSKEV
jgi:hypothetical protein